MTPSRFLYIVETVFLSLTFTNIDLLSKVFCSVLVSISTAMLIVINWPKFWARIQAIKNKWKK